MHWPYCFGYPLSSFHSLWLRNCVYLWHWRAACLVQRPQLLALTDGIPTNLANYLSSEAIQLAWQSSVTTFIVFSPIRNTWFDVIWGGILYHQTILPGIWIYFRMIKLENWFKKVTFRVLDLWFWGIDLLSWVATFPNKWALPHVSCSSWLPKRSFPALVWTRFFPELKLNFHSPNLWCFISET